MHRCLSVCQPFATAIVLGLKPFENRTWGTSYRGPLLIHASRSLTFMGRGMAWLEDLREVACQGLPRMPRGMLVGGTGSLLGMRRDPGTGERMNGERGPICACWYYWPALAVFAFLLGLVIGLTW
jgi:hypothetical protein